MERVERKAVLSPCLKHRWCRSVGSVCADMLVLRLYNHLLLLKLNQISFVNANYWHLFKTSLLKLSFNRKILISMKQNHSKQEHVLIAIKGMSNITISWNWNRNVRLCQLFLKKSIPGSFFKKSLLLIKDLTNHKFHVLKRRFYLYLDQMSSADRGSRFEEPVLKHSAQRAVKCLCLCVSVRAHMHAAGQLWIHCKKGL